MSGEQERLPEFSGYASYHGLKTGDNRDNQILLSFGNAPVGIIRFKEDGKFTGEFRPEFWEELQKYMERRGFDTMLDVSFEFRSTRRADDG